LKSLERDPKPEHLEALRLAIDKETNADLSAELQRLERLLTVQFDPTEQARIEAIKSFDGDLKLDARARLNPIFRRIKSILRL